MRATTTGPGPHFPDAGYRIADDGELFLEYRQSEALVFDNGRLKQATYDTSQGFGLRAVKDEAVGYAHASDCPRRRSRAPPTRARGQGRLFRHVCRGPAAHQPSLYGDDNPLGAPAVRGQGEAAGEIDAYARAKDPRVRQVIGLASAATWQAVEILRADGETYRDIRPLVRVNVSVVVGDGDRQETGSYGYGGREGYERFIEPGRPGASAVDDAVRQALVNLEAVPAPAGEMDVVLGPAGPASCCTKRSATGSKAISTARRPRPSPA
jgi:TldD protein